MILYLFCLFEFFGVDETNGFIKGTCRVDDYINLFKGRYHGVMLVDIHFNKGGFFIFLQFGGQSFTSSVKVCAPEGQSTGRSAVSATWRA